MPRSKSERRDPGDDIQTTATCNRSEQEEASGKLNIENRGNASADKNGRSFNLNAMPGGLLAVGSRAF